MSTNDSQKLRECPFCGGGAKAKESLRSFTSELWEMYVYVVCKKCGATVEGADKAEAIEAWNTRHERTCRNEFDRCFAFECSECGVNVEGGDMLGHNSSEGAFNFCPNCGAKVVE